VEVITSLGHITTTTTTTTNIKGHHRNDLHITDLQVRVLFPALPDFLRYNGSGTGTTHPREFN
jgi:hypothetical protein